MGDLAAVAERLRLVRRAHRRFVRLWRLHEIFMGPGVIESVQADVEQTGPDETTTTGRQATARRRRPPPPATPGGR